MPCAYRKRLKPLYKPSGPAQCFSCQWFIQNFPNCGHPPRCVKCVDAHIALKCSETRRTLLTCCKCGPWWITHHKFLKHKAVPFFLKPLSKHPPRTTVVLHPFRTTFSQPTTAYNQTQIKHSKTQRMTLFKLNSPLFAASLQFTKTQSPPIHS